MPSAKPPNEFQGDRHRPSHASAAAPAGAGPPARPTPPRVMQEVHKHCLSRTIRSHQDLLPPQGVKLTPNHVITQDFRKAATIVALSASSRRCVAISSAARSAT